MDQNDLSIKAFNKAFWPLYLCLILLMLFGIAIFCVIFRGRLNDISAWASIIAGIISYIGSSILGIFVFYHSWIQVMQQKRTDDISVMFSLSSCEQNDSLTTFQEDSIRKKYPHVSSRYLANGRKSKTEITQFAKLMLTNCNCFLPIQLEITNLYYLDDDNVFVSIHPIKTRSIDDLSIPIDYKNKAEIFIGIPNEVFLEKRYIKHNVFVFSIVFKLTNPKSTVRYGFITLMGGKSWRTTSGLFSQEQKDLYEKQYGSIIGLNKSDKSYLKMMCPDE